MIYVAYHGVHLKKQEKEIELIYNSDWDVKTYCEMAIYINSLGYHVLVSGTESVCKYLFDNLDPRWFKFIYPSSDIEWEWLFLLKRMFDENPNKRNRYEYEDAIQNFQKDIKRFEQYPGEKVVIKSTNKYEVAI